MSEPEEYAWAYQRVVNMAANARCDARIYGLKLLKGFGYPNEVFSRAQDARALQIVLEAAPKPASSERTDPA
jgi:hypothetical protein